jgi:hypothetical protein
MNTQPIATTSKCILSRLHEYQGGWKPEADSPAGVRGIIENARHATLSELMLSSGGRMPVFDISSFSHYEKPADQYVYHWAKSKSCQMVNNPRLRRYIEHKVLFNHAMSEKPMSVVCSECYAEFMDRNVVSRVAANGHCLPLLAPLANTHRTDEHRTER